MIPYTIARYFLISHIKTLLWFLLGVAAIIFLVDFSENVGRTAGVSSVNVSDVLLLTASRLPLMLQQTIPFVVLFSSMITLITLNRKQELVVVRAAGISVWQFMSPFCLGALLFGIAVTTILNPLAASGMAFATNLQSGWDAGSSAQNNQVPWLRQITNGDDVIIGARNVIDNGTSLAGVVIFHFDPAGNIVLREDASTAKLEHGYWQLNDVIQTRPGEIPKRLESEQLPTNLRKEFVQEQLSQPETVGFFSLPHKIAAARMFGVSTAALETQYHSLLSLPFMLIAMTMIAGTVSLKFSRFSQSPSLILGGILSGFMLYVVTVLVKAFGSSGLVPPFVATWIPVIVAVSIGATVLLHQEDG